MRFIVTFLNFFCILILSNVAFGNVKINNETELKTDANQLIEFNQDGDHFSIKGQSKSKLLFLSGKPINEKVTSWGPYVMNTQTEIMEALRDYKQGKMGFLPR